MYFFFSGKQKFRVIVEIENNQQACKKKENGGLFFSILTPDTLLFRWGLDDSLRYGQRWGGGPGSTNHSTSTLT